MVTGSWGNILSKIEIWWTVVAIWENPPQTCTVPSYCLNYFVILKCCLLWPCQGSSLHQIFFGFFTREPCVLGLVTKLSSSLPCQALLVSIWLSPSQALWVALCPRFLFIIIISDLSSNGQHMIQEFPGNKVRPCCVVYQYNYYYLS